MILEEMFRGNFHPAEPNIPIDDHYRAELDKICKLEDQLNPQLSPENRSLLEKLLSQISSVHCMDLEQTFSFAFAAGIRLQQEVQEQMRLWSIQ